jgi:hypothetical protein
MWYIVLNRHPFTEHRCSSKFAVDAVTYRYVAMYGLGSFTLMYQPG